MAKIDKTTIVDASQDDSLTWQKSGNNITLGPYPDKTYVDKKTEIINEPSLLKLVMSLWVQNSRLMLCII